MSQNRNDTIAYRRMGVAVCFVSLAACSVGSHGGRNTNERSSAGVWYVVPLTPEEQEARARLLPVCEFPEFQTAGWTEHVFAPHFRVVLPPEFAGQRHLPNEKRSWGAADGSLFLITRHAGDGLAATRIISAEPGTFEDAVSCRVTVAGRSAVLSTWKETLKGRPAYVAAMDAGVRAGLGIGVAIHAVTPERRAELVTALRSITVIE